MIKTATSLLLFVLITACGNDSQQETSSLAVPADTIYINGEVITMDEGQPSADALAIRGAEIVAVGSTNDISLLKGPATEVIDLAGNVVLPGFFDLHVHPVFAGMQASLCQIPQGSNLDQIKTIVKACVDKAEPGEWIRGGQWDTSAIGHVPHRSSLDEVAPDNPVFLGDTSEHSFWANSLALQLSGVDRDTPDPENGIIERDSSGEATGVMREGAASIVRSHAPEASDEAVRRALALGLDTMLSFGVTSFSEAATGYASNAEKEVRAFAEMADAGQLKQRARICLPWTPGNEDIERLISNRQFYNRDLVSLDCIKMFLDGVPTDGHTAAMLEPYADSLGTAGEPGEYGMLMVEQPTLNEAVTRFDSMGLTVKFHSAGDAAVRAGLDAIEVARTANGMNSLRHNVGHCTFISPEDIPRAIALGATFELSPYLWSPSPINDSITAAVGTERIKRVWPMREVIESGALAVPGSDWSVVPSVNPWIAIEALVTREMTGGSDNHFGKEQAITASQAIELFTVNSARHMGRAHDLGRIKAGMLADFVVLDRNPYTIDSNRLHQVTVNRTVINGESVYQTGSKQD